MAQLCLYYKYTGSHCGLCFYEATDDEILELVAGANC